jgi:hypothetical protein
MVKLNLSLCTKIHPLPPTIPARLNKETFQPVGKPPELVWFGEHAELIKENFGIRKLMTD